MPDICLECIEDSALRDLLQSHSHQVRCKYCGQSGRGVSIEELASVVDEPLRQCLRQGGEVQHFTIESDSPHYEQEGDDLTLFIQEELGIDIGPAEDLAAVLVANDPADVSDGEEPFFDETQQYVRADLHPWEYIEAWRAFATQVKHGRRFFDPTNQDRLAAILGSPGDEIASSLPSLLIGPGRETEVVFRARRADSHVEAEKLTTNPAAELGPPPPLRATAGRMNAAGIAVFYGALSEDTAIAEVRQSVGGLIVVGAFKLTKLLKLLDLTRIGDASVGSIFAPGYEDRAARLAFLRGFHARIVRPVQPHEEAFEYIPTQAVAEYVANILGFDGLLYASSQLGIVEEIEGSLEITPEHLAACNVVLFGRAAVVAEDATKDHCLEVVDGSVKMVRVQRVTYETKRFFGLASEVDDLPAEFWDYPPL
jgi:hypothetical protein